MTAIANGTAVRNYQHREAARSQENEFQFLAARREASL